MSSLWTPDGERPVGREPSPRAATGPAAPVPDGDDDREPSAEEIAAYLDELAATPAEAVIVNHCVGLFELARLHLSVAPPQLPKAQLAIDALSAIVEGLSGRLGPDEQNLRDGLAQIKLAFVQVRAAAEGAPAPPPG